jgi:hypothetical protein
MSEQDRERGTIRHSDIAATIDSPKGRPSALRTIFVPESEQYDIFPPWADNVQPVGCLACKSGKWMENSFFLGKTYSCEHIFTNHECDGTFSGTCYHYFLERETRNITDAAIEMAREGDG